MKFHCKENELEAPAKYLRTLLIEKNIYVVLLTGEMGAGKTTFTRHLCKILGSNSTINSPTYSFLNEYKLGEDSIFHFDLFRIQSEDELEGIGFEEVLALQNITIIEWWKIAKGSIPKNAVEVEIKIESETMRNFDIKIL
ncbi:MAG: tRNA (adenosine(37)-N6)-threonylcarbamoyltransferase complex ATPase subunit type 1 TsaE [Leptospiraceae bacterium]|nr:tRNA (adenosine(37)-N6)-threonylcarbamoyltransferase complex ATPase subunit type 1 TsaE [Leptospiraceae bacterium]MCK6381569.1 tRNA (adenosine(37)-N6)-threonylcarbamoyltransferase complex ATPase subunit type 1 TsaE [Leptospiraceae bacterium]NUM41668.1 tRNA (adenosine(37)-N6)-threonylcarbamoyltransferase complex ATPase subunit type 1 TsaE [Leptospiraceae bacterium]